MNLLPIDLLIAAAAEVAGIVELFKAFGGPTVAAGIMVWLYQSSRKEHRDERKEWRAESQRQEDKSIKAIEGLTEAISDMAASNKKGKG